MWFMYYAVFIIVIGLDNVLLYPGGGRHVATARIESCTGCQLAKYPGVKKFLEMDIRDFDDVTFKEVPGSLPEIVFFNRHDEELERHPLKCKSSEDCSNILLLKGFKRKSKDIKKSHLHIDI